MKMFNGFWLPDSDNYFAPFLENSDGFQLDHLEKALEYVTNFSGAIDGGAHIGTWTLAMAEKFSAVFAFEPAIDTFECLEANVLGKRNVNIINSALGEYDGMVSIIDDVKRLGNTGSRYIQPGYDVLMTQIDSLKLVDLGMLKLDVEGYEYFALKGAENSIMKYKPVVVIEEKKFGPRFGIPVGKASEFLIGLGMHEVACIGKDHIFIF